MDSMRKYSDFVDGQILGIYNSQIVLCSVSKRQFACVGSGQKSLYVYFPMEIKTADQPYETL